MSCNHNAAFPQIWSRPKVGTRECHWASHAACLVLLFIGRNVPRIAGYERGPAERECAGEHLEPCSNFTTSLKSNDLSISIKLRDFYCPTLNPVTLNMDRCRSSRFQKHCQQRSLRRCTPLPRSVGFVPLHSHKTHAHRQCAGSAPQKCVRGCAE
jgi:hypothetical protein